MSGTFPATPAPSRVALKSSGQTLVSYSQSGRRFARAGLGQRWLVTASYGPLTSDEGRSLIGFCASQQGQLGTFSYLLPSHATPRGVATGTPLVNGASQTSASVITDGWAVSVTNILKAGDLIKFAGHSKVYMQTVDVNSNASGQVTLTLNTPLIASPADNEAITTSNINFTMAFSRDVEEFPIRAPQIYGYDVELIEVY